MDATTTVKVSTRASRKLDELQARVQLRTGERPTKQTLIESLIDRALEESEPLVLLPPPKRALTPRARRALLRYPLDWGVETGEAEIDAILYGGDS